ncbi:cellulase family glycosylhydrolase [Nocardiopsis quinghaiensis]|uniref:cellulase family glycosylhydrolase n=1 Tax=Nocardiopsis quinghaiensis TaxID=464995 RepID=UPI0016804293|nr:cellulase family glycosylhydrolase [Nocardiopsis quinghaiensis]
MAPPPSPARGRTVLAVAALVGALLATLSPAAPAAARGPADTPPAAGTGSAARSAADAVEAHGQLRVCGLKLCDESGDPVQLTGMSSHGLQWYGDCLTDGSLDALAHDWGADVLRVSMYIQEGGYETDPRGFTDRVHELIEEGTERGMYVIVDWHMLTPGDPNHNTDLARTFFTEIAAAHADKDNVLYEIANEPNHVSWSAIKGYAEEIIPVVRAEDPEAVVLVGTRGWSSLGLSDGSDHTEITADPVDADNIMYVFHFYAATHGDFHREGLRAAARELPLFVTEFGTQEATGDGPDDFASAQAYLDLMAEEQISWVNWNFSDDFRSGAVFEPGTCAAGGPWAGTDALKPAGEWIRDRIRESGDVPPTDPTDPSDPPTDPDECEVPAWSPETVYTGEDRVGHGGRLYEAQWWTRGEEPGTTGEWGVWRDLGAC